MPALLHSFLAEYIFFSVNQPLGRFSLCICAMCVKMCVVLCVLRIAKIAKLGSIFFGKVLREKNYFVCSLKLI